LEVTALLRQAREAKDTAAEAILLQERHDSALLVASAHPGFLLVDTGCDTCHGTGLISLSRNPAKHVDWWVIGGRWNRFFRLDDDATAECESELDGNTALVEELSSETIPSAIVTPDGLWHEAPFAFGLALMPLSESDRDAHADWCREARALIKSYPNHLVVAVDCHT